MTEDTVTVLHVDPDPELAEGVANHLGAADDVAVVTAESGRAGLERLAAGGIDCVVGGHDPPGMDGIGFLERVRDRDEEVPVILFADPSADAADAARDAGAAGYLETGDTMALLRLRDRVRRAISDRRAVDPRTLGTVVEGLADPVYVLDAEGRIAAANEAFLDLTGHDRASVLGSDASLVVTPGTAARSGAIRDAVRAADGPDEARYEVEIRTAEGGTVRCEDHVAVLPFGEGRPDGVVGVLRDVSRRERRERVLAALHETARELMIADSEAAVADRVMEAAETVLGLTHVGVHLYDEEREELVPVAWTDGIEATIGEPPVLGPDSLAWEAFRTGETRRYEDLSEAEGLANPETPLRSELIVPLGERGVVIFGATEPAAFTGEDEQLAQVLCANATAALDRTERAAVLRRRERDLERENERLERLTRFLSHDLRSPLEVAKGRTELAREAQDSEHLETVAGALDRMETLVGDLLAMAREGRTVDRTEPVDLAAAARESWANVETGGAVLRTATDATILADGDRLARVVENLFRNSVEHGATSGRTASGEGIEHGATSNRTASGDSAERRSTGDRPGSGSGDGPDGGPENGGTAGEDGVADGGVTVTVGDLADGFYVEDDGPGIPADEREAVFEAGYSTAADGNGFGLAIVAEIVEAHGWSVEATESEAGGARFEITGVERA